MAKSVLLNVFWIYSLVSFTLIIIVAYDVSAAVQIWGFARVIERVWDTCFTAVKCQETQVVCLFCAVTSELHEFLQKWNFRDNWTIRNIFVVLK